MNRALENSNSLVIGLSKMSFFGHCFSIVEILKTLMFSKRLRHNFLKTLCKKKALNEKNAFKLFKFQ